MKIVVIDGQGGNIGRRIVEEIKAKKTGCEILAIGTNSTATALMMKGGADVGATGENPVVLASRDADVIIRMAEAIGASKARKILIPINKCVTVAGVDESMSISDYIKIAVDKI